MTTRATNGRREWTADEHAELWRMKCEGVRLSEMARRLKRNESSCHGRLKNSDDSGQYIGRGKSVRWTPDIDAQALANLDSAIASGPSIRRCLMCGHEFQSSSAGNRRCKPCKRRAEDSDSPFNPGIVGGI